MPDIKHKLKIEVSAEEVFRAVAETDGLAAWWIPQVEGKSQEANYLTIKTI
ncbi:MAG: hypothetical protein R3345_03045 [Fulvivirga sp.]|nr:hypothetical protein [Fulvivirga sp.]